MSEPFLGLPDEDRRDILDTLSSTMSRRAVVLEKDVWVCWGLKYLFDMPERPAMAFKGGTSLSKVYDVVDRFSEDIDVTVDYRSLDPGFNIEGATKNGIKRETKKLRGLLQEHVHDVVAPHLSKQLGHFDDRHTVSVSDNGEELRLHYPSVVADVEDRYIKDSVLLEFGGRNITEPNERHTIVPYIAAAGLALDLPRGDVDVLAGGRTFWEKVTLVHVECHKPEPKPDANRMSRHWYDLDKLASHVVGKRAIADTDLMGQVVDHKMAFYDSKHANYEKVKQGLVRLVPDAPLRMLLADDYGKMVDEGMFYVDTQSFDDLMTAIGELEGFINAAILKSG